MTPLIDTMVQDDPSKRPTMEEVVPAFDAILQSLSSCKTRTRLRPLREHQYPAAYRAHRALSHAVNTATHILTFKSAIPRP